MQLRMYYMLTSRRSWENTHYLVSRKQDTDSEVRVLATVVGDKQRGENQRAQPHWGASSAPPHPRTDLITPAPFHSWEAFTDKAVCGEVGITASRPVPNAPPKADGPQGPQGDDSTGECGPREQEEASERAASGLLVPGEPQSSPFLQAAEPVIPSAPPSPQL